MRTETASAVAEETRDSRGSSRGEEIHLLVETALGLLVIGTETGAPITATDKTKIEKYRGPHKVKEMIGETGGENLTKHIEIEKRGPETVIKDQKIEELIQWTRKIHKFHKESRVMLDRTSRSRTGRRPSIKWEYPKHCRETIGLPRPMQGMWEMPRATLVTETRGNIMGQPS